jgi:predicted nucleic acid-binding protein
MGIVVDTSYAISLALDEGDVPDAATVIEHIATTGMHVPSLWRFEVGNVLLIAVRKGRISAARRLEILADFEALPVTVDEASATRAWSTGMDLAERHGLTIYDAAYLELALRLALPLASRDSELIDAARAEGVSVFG